MSVFILNGITEMDRGVGLTAGSRRGAMWYYKTSFHFRHSIATHMLKRGLLGYDSPTTTARLVQ